MDILDLITTESISQGFDPSFVATVVRKESGFKPDAVSPTGAVGLGQITSVALEHYNTSTNSVYEREDLFVPSINIRVTVWYMKWIAKALKIPEREFTRFSKSSRVRIYAAYNVGIGTLKKLESNKIDNSVRRLVSFQASALSAGGPERYLDNVRTFLA